MRYFRFVLVFIFSIGLAYSVYGFFKNIFRAFDNEELPLHNIQGIIVSDSVIYIGLGEYGEIQEYSLDGKFRKHYKANSSKWGFTFVIDSNGNVLSNPKKTISDMELVTGKMPDEDPAFLEPDLAHTNIEQLFYPLTFQTLSGDKYAIEGEYFLSLYKYHGTMRTPVVIQSWFVKSLKGTFTPWVIGLIAVLSIVAVNISAVAAYIERNRY